MIGYRLYGSKQPVPPLHEAPPCVILLCVFLNMMTMSPFSNLQSLICASIEEGNNDAAGRSRRTDTIKALGSSYI